MGNSISPTNTGKLGAEVRYLSSNVLAVPVRCRDALERASKT